MPVGYQGHFRYALRVVITIKSMPWTKKVYLYNQKRYFYPIWGFGLILANFGLIWPLMWPKFDPNLTQISALYFQNWLFLPNLALRWPKFDPIWSIWLILSLIKWLDICTDVSDYFEKRKVLGLYFQNWLFWHNLAQIWPKCDPIWSI